MTAKASRHLDRVSKLLNQAERAPEGSPEREAFMAKAIALAQANSIDLALARSHQANKEKVEQIEERQVTVGDRLRLDSYDYYGRTDRVSNNTKWLCELLTEIAEPNDVKCLISRDKMYVWLTGFPSDLDVVERLYAALAVQMVSEADKYIKAGKHKNPDPVPVVRMRRVETYDEEGKVNGARYEDYTVMEKPAAVDGRVWRTNFYAGFIARVVGRMWQERREARKAAGVTDINDESNETAVAIRDKEGELKSHWEERIKHIRGVSKGAQVSQYDESGRQRGQEVGARANLGRDARVGSEERKEIG